MESNLRNFRSQIFIHRFLKREYFEYYIIIIWLLGFTNNILLMLDLEKEYPNIRDSNTIAARGSISSVRHTIDAFIMIFSSALLFMWFVLYYQVNTIEMLQRYEMNNKFTDMTKLDYLYIYLCKSFLYEREVIALLVHVTFGALCLTNQDHMYF